MGFSEEEEWGPAEAMTTQLFTAGDPSGEGPSFRSDSLSGGERNRMFFRRDGNYKDMTLVSGADFREDGRGFVLLDFDQDGWLDMGVTSPNHPRFRLLRNRIGDGESAEGKNSFVELALVGGQTTAEPTQEWSSRDPFGATVLVTTGSTTRKFQLSCGEGLSGQNAKRIHVGMGRDEKIDELTVNWPSGKITVLKDIPAGKRLTVFENP